MDFRRTISLLHRADDAERAAAARVLDGVDFTDIPTVEAFLAALEGRPLGHEAEALSRLVRVLADEAVRAKILPVILSKCGESETSSLLYWVAESAYPERAVAIRVRAEIGGFRSALMLLEDKRKPLDVRSAAAAALERFDEPEVKRALDEFRYESQVTDRDVSQMTDQEGGTYKAVRIGGQEWMAENLNVGHYRNGDPIPQVQLMAEWAELEKGAWCYYRNDVNNGRIYGKLYNWAAVNDSRGLAPEGWHVPSDDEWRMLSDHLGGADLAGGKMKEAGITHWRNPNAGGTNESGFTALPGGKRDEGGTFREIGDYGIYWSSTERSDISGAWNRYLACDDRQVTASSDYEQVGLSVRCVRDL